MTESELKKLAQLMRESNDSGMFVQDKRIDRGIAWVVTTVLAVILSLSSWFIKGMHEDVGQMKLDVAVLKTTVVNISDLRKTFDQQQALDREERMQLRSRLTELERKAKQ